jgi:hypothetical protein
MQEAGHKIQGKGPRRLPPGDGCSILSFMNELLLLALRELIGREAVLEGVHCQVIEILEHGPCVVVCEIRHTEIQPDQFGEAHRRVPPTHTVPVLSQVGHDLHPVVRTLAGEALSHRLRSLL